MNTTATFTSNQMYLLDKCFEHRNIQNNAAHLLPYIKRDSRIIDVGCSTGAITLSLAQHVPDGFVLGIDHEPAAIEMCREKAKASGLTNCEFAVMDAENMKEIENDSFDIAHAHHVITHVTNPVTVFKEMRRVIKPGGIASSRDNCAVRRYPEHPLLEKHLDSFIAASEERGAHPRDSYKNHHWLQMAGFAWDKIKVDGAHWDWSSPQQRRLWAEGIFAGGLRDVQGDVDELKKEIEEWISKDETRILALDSVVVGEK